MLRKLILWVVPVAVLLGLLFGLNSALGIPLGGQTIDTAEACLPCYCPDDLRINCHGNEYYGVYTRLTRSGQCYIDVLLIDQETGRGRRAIRLTAAEQAEVPEFPEENLLVEQYYEVALYRLTTGEWQVNAGPTAEGKVYVVVFTGCPATNVYEYDFFVPVEGG
jgi:hypothetical protein